MQMQVPNSQVSDMSAISLHPSRLQRHSSLGPKVDAANVRTGRFDDEGEPCIGWLDELW